MSLDVTQLEDPLLVISRQVGALVPRLAHERGGAVSRSSRTSGEDFRARLSAACLMVDAELMKYSNTLVLGERAIPSDREAIPYRPRPVDVFRFRTAGWMMVFPYYDLKVMK
jgi:hypothetical protein